MRKSKKLTHRSVRIQLSMLLLSAVTVAAWPQAMPDFSGLWKQDNDRGQPKRSADVTLHIEHHDPDLTEIHDRWNSFGIDGSGRGRIPHNGRLEGLQPRLHDRGARRRPHSSLAGDVVAH